LFVYVFFFYESKENWWIHWLVYYMQIVITMYVHCEVRHDMIFSHCCFKLLLLQFLILNTSSLLACFFKLLLHFSISQLVSYEKKFKFIFWALKNKQYFRFIQKFESHYMFTNIYEFYLVWKFCKLFWIYLISLRVLFQQWKSLLIYLSLNVMEAQYYVMFNLELF